MKVPEISHFAPILFGGLVFVAAASCTTAPDGKTPPLVAAPVMDPATETADGAGSADPAKEKKVKDGTSPGIAENTPAPAAKPKSANDPVKMAAEADARVSWSSSQSTLREAFAQTGEAEKLAPENPSIALQHARHGLMLAATESGIDRPAAIAKTALRSMDAADLKGDDLEPVAAYYRASLTGLVMQAQGLGAAGKLPELEKQFRRATGAPGTDSGGPYRALGMLYLKAPAWPTGIGDIGLALENLEKAATSYSDFPHNHICLARALADDGSGEDAEASLKRAEELLASGNWGAFESVWRQEIAEIRSDSAS